MWITCGRIKLLHIIFDTTGWLSHLRTIPTNNNNTRRGSTAGAIEEHFGGGVWGGWCPDGNDDNLRQECRLEFTPPHSVHSQSVSLSVSSNALMFFLGGWWFVVIIILRWVLWSPIKIVSIQRLSPSSFGMQTFSTGIIRCMRLTIPMSGRFWLVRPNKVLGHAADVDDQSRFQDDVMGLEVF